MYKGVLVQYSAVILVRFLWNLNFLDVFFERYWNINFR